IAGMVQLNAIGRDALIEAGGAHAVTDVTGFGLAGHAAEMADGAVLAVEIDTRALPIIEGAEALAVPRFYPRASQANTAFREGRSRIEEGADPIGVEFAFDAQTSGGLLIAVDPAHAGRLVEGLRRRGALAAATIGRVTERQGPVAVILR